MLTRVIKRGTWIRIESVESSIFSLNRKLNFERLWGTVGPLLMMALTGEPVWGLNDPFGGLAHPDTFLSSLQP